MAPCTAPRPSSIAPASALASFRRRWAPVAPLALSLCSVIGLAGCPEPDGDAGVDGGGTGCDPTIVGDLAEDLEMEIVLRTATGGQVDAVPYGPVELFRPPQGGKVFLVGARVKNVDICGLRITGSLRDPCDERILAFESRPFRTYVTDAGYAEPINPNSLSNYANVPACPRAQAGRRVNDNLYEMTVLVEALDGRSREMTIPVVPVCAQPGVLGDQCACECEQGYVLGEECEVVEDAGTLVVDDAGVPVLVCE